MPCEAYILSATNEHNATCYMSRSSGTAKHAAVLSMSQEMQITGSGSHA